MPPITPSRAALVLGLAGAALLGATLFPPQPTQAQSGIPFPEPLPDRWIPPPIVEPHPIITRNLSLLRYSAAVTITAGTAHTRVTLDFRNDTPGTLEGDFVFPVPKDAILTDFALRDGDQRLQPELLEANQAREWYLEIVRKAIDPGLLEYVNQRAYRVRAFPFAPGQTRAIELSFTHQLPNRGAVQTYALPLQFAAPNVHLINNLQSQPGLRGEQIGRPMPPPVVTPTFVATVEVNDPNGLGTVSCPTHALSFTREGTTRARGSVEGPLTPATGTFELLIGRSNDEFAASLLTWPGTGNEPGYFALTLYPSLKSDSKPLPKDVMLVLDTSGSMAGEKWEQARSALQYVIEHLGAEDHASLIDYSDLVSQAWSGFRPATSTTRSEARTYLQRLSAAGGTNIYDALHLASRTIAEHRSNRPGYLLFFTDGLPTVGNTDIGAIKQVVAQTLPGSARLYTFGVGYDVNTTLLDGLARQHGGVSDYVEPGQHIESVVSAFYQKIQHPALTTVAINWGPLQTRDVILPPTLDLFHGTQVTITGRYTGQAPTSTSISLRGTAAGQSRTIPLKITPVNDPACHFVPRLWANARIARLIDQLQRTPGSTELVDEIRQLAQRYGIVTPYTSYLVREDFRFNTLAQEAEVRDRALAAPQSGEGAVQRSQALNRKGWTVSEAAPSAGFSASDDMDAQEEDLYNQQRERPAPAPIAGRPATANALPQEFLNQIGNLTFLQAGIGMVDTRYSPMSNIRVLQVAAFSEQHLALLRHLPELGPVFAQGAEVTLQVAPDLVLQTVLLDESAQPVTESQVNALRRQEGSRSPEGFRALNATEWSELTKALTSGYWRG